MNYYAVADEIARLGTDGADPSPLGELLRRDISSSQQMLTLLRETASNGNWYVRNQLAAHCIDVFKRSDRKPALGAGKLLWEARSERDGSGTIDMILMLVAWGIRAGAETTRHECVNLALMALYGLDTLPAFSLPTSLYLIDSIYERAPWAVTSLRHRVLPSLQRAQAVAESMKRNSEVANERLRRLSTLIDILTHIES